MVLRFQQTFELDSEMTLESQKLDKGLLAAFQGKKLAKRMQSAIVWVPFCWKVQIIELNELPRKLFNPRSNQRSSKSGASSWDGREVGIWNGFRINPLLLIDVIFFQKRMKDAPGSQGVGESEDCRFTLGHPEPA
jgi:hypothetical protein